MMNICPIILNKSFEQIGVIDDYTSLIWTSRYYGCGDFELCVPVIRQHTALLKQGYYVARADDEHVGIIEDIKIQRSEDMKELCIVKGRFLSSIVGRRIIGKQTQVSGTVQACIQTLMNQNILNPSDAARKIPNLTFTSKVATNKRMDAQYTGKNLLTTIEEICTEYGIGFKTLLTNDNKFAFQLYEGVDRSYNQSVNPYIVFSDEYDNLLSSEYEENYYNTVTSVLVGGEGEGTDRKVVWAEPTSTTSLDRYEVFKDARNATTNNGAIPDNVYLQQLRQEGLESITKFTKAFTGKVYFGAIKYRQDINVGDICVIENTRWDLSVNARLVEVIESVAETGAYTITPTFAL